MLSLLLESRSWKSTGTLRNPSGGLLSAIGGEASTAGPAVSFESALRFPPVWRAVNLIASYVAKVPCHVYRRAGEGKERERDHPAYWLVRRMASPTTPVYFHRYAQTAQALLRGNAYSYIVRDRSFRPRELIALDPAVTWADREDGVLKYLTILPDGAEYVMGSEEVLHIRALSDGIDGTSVIAKARESLGAGLAIQEYEGRFFANSARPSSVIEHPRRIGADAVETLRRSWMEIYGGLRNAHKPGILEEGAQLKVFGLSNADAQLAESAQGKIREVANWFGVPPHKLGDDARTSYNSLEMENQAFLDDCLDNWLSAWEAEYWDKLLTDREKRDESIIVEFLRAALVRADLKARSAFYHAAISAGWMSRDEVRAKENMNPIPGGEGAKYLVPLNMSPAGEAGAEPDGDQDDEELAERMAARSKVEREILAATLARMARRMTTRAERAARHPESWLAFVDSLSADDVFTSATRPICSLCEVDPEQLAAGFYAQIRAEFDQCADVTPERLAGEVEAASRRIESELPARLLAQFGG